MADTNYEVLIKAMDILKRIEDLRFKKGWSIYMMAKESALDQATIAAWYYKGRKPSVDSLEKICDGFDITMSRFFADDSDDEQVVLTQSQKELLNCWDTLSRRQKASMLQLMKDIPNNNL